MRVLGLARMPATQVELQSTFGAALMAARCRMASSSSRVDKDDVIRHMAELNAALTVLLPLVSAQKAASKASAKATSNLQPNPAPSQSKPAVIQPVPVVSSVKGYPYSSQSAPSTISSNVSSVPQYTTPKFPGTSSTSAAKPASTPPMPKPSQQAYSPQPVPGKKPVFVPTPPSQSGWSPWAVGGFIGVLLTLLLTLGGNDDTGVKSDSVYASPVIPVAIGNWDGPQSPVSGTAPSPVGVTPVDPIPVTEPESSIAHALVISAARTDCLVKLLSFPPSDVLVDGVYLGEAPSPNWFPLAAGRHLFEVYERPETNPFLFKCELESGKRYVVQMNLDQRTYSIQEDEP
jgi:hypothetical protein